MIEYSDSNYELKYCYRLVLFMRWEFVCFFRVFFGVALGCDGAFDARVGSNYVHRVGHRRLQHPPNFSSQHRQLHVVIIVEYEEQK